MVEGMSSCLFCFLLADTYENGNYFLANFIAAQVRLFKLDFRNPLSVSYRLNIIRELCKCSVPHLHGKTSLLL